MALAHHASPPRAFSWHFFGYFTFISSRVINLKTTHFIGREIHVFISSSTYERRTSTPPGVTTWASCCIRAVVSACPLSQTYDTSLTCPLLVFQVLFLFRTHIRGLCVTQRASNWDAMGDKAISLSRQCVLACAWPNTDIQPLLHWFSSNN